MSRDATKVLKKTAQTHSSQNKGFSRLTQFSGLYQIVNYVNT